MKTGYTFADWLQLPHERGLHEIIDGELVVSPAPLLYHQTIALRLSVQLVHAIEEAGHGRVFSAPAGVRLAHRQVFEPDVFVVLREREHLLHATHCDGPPDLVVEALSPGSVRRDRVVKFGSYERAGVREYWIVDPERHELDQHVLVDSRFQLVARSGTEIRLHVVDAAVDLTRVW
jgi:Uma2 family endonuclease